MLGDEGDAVHAAECCLRVASADVSSSNSPRFDRKSDTDGRNYDETGNRTTYRSCRGTSACREREVAMTVIDNDDVPARYRSASDKSRRRRALEHGVETTTHGPQAGKRCWFSAQRASKRGSSISASPMSAGVWPGRTSFMPSANSSGVTW